MAKDTKIELADALDRALLEVVRDGVPVLDEDGQPVKDVDGKPIRQQAPAAYFSVARARLRDCGVSRLAVPGGDLDALSKQVLDEKDDGRPPTLKLRLPELSDDDSDDAATGT